MSEASEILAAFAAVGFEAQSSGGGFNALFAGPGSPAVDVAGASIGVSNGDDQVPTSWDADCVVCFYVGGEQVSHIFTTPRAFLATLPKRPGESERTPDGLFGRVNDLYTEYDEGRATLDETMAAMDAAAREHLGGAS